MQDGAVLCTVEDKTTPNKEYTPVIYAANGPNEVTAPPEGTEVIVERVRGQYIVTGTIRAPPSAGKSEPDILAGTNQERGSVSFVFGQSGEEFLSVEYRDGGYVFNLDVKNDVTVKSQGDITIDAPQGDVQISEGGTTKKVATEDHTHSLTYDGGGDNSGSRSTTTDKPDDNTQVELE
jgi:hypothetical protein